MHHICCISDSDKHFSSAIQEYLKRLGKDVQITHLKPVKHGSREQIITQETTMMSEWIAKHITSDTDVFLLSKEGKQVTTEQLVDVTARRAHQIWLIWWPYGLDEWRLAGMIDGRMSFWAVTLPHWLAQLVLLEQIYRVSTIRQGKQYHY